MGWVSAKGNLRDGRAGIHLCTHEGTCDLTVHPGCDPISACFEYPYDVVPDSVPPEERARVLTNKLKHVDDQLTVNADVDGALFYTLT